MYIITYLLISYFISIYICVDKCCMHTYSIILLDLIFNGLLCIYYLHLQLTELEYRMNRMDSVLVDYDALQTEIESLSDNPDEQLTERGHFESQFYSAMSLSRTMLAPDFVRLPKIDLPHFDGDYQHWLGFRDTYLSLIHNNNSLSDIHKFHYLRAALQGSAALLIQSLDLKIENYAIAWQLLSERYDNQKLLVNNHLQALFNLQNIQRENGSLMRNMVDTINENLRALATLGEPTDHWDTIIIFIMSKKLDNASSRQWEEYRNTLAGNNSPSLQQFLKFLNNRADLLDTVQEQNVQASQSNNTKGFIVTSNNITSTYKNKLNYTKNPMCPMCSDNHFLFACPTFKTLSVDLRIKKVTEARVCKNCLRPGHINKNCRLSHCKYCQLKHNTLLHKEVGSETRPPPSLENNVALSSNIALPSSNRGLVLLSTALVKVRDIHGYPHAVRLLLDNGSTANFVTQHLCEKLGLVRRNTNSTVSDASERAYGACVYIRNVGEDGTICVRLLISKNRVAPIKPTTIPKLELCGALLGTRLCRKVQNSLTIPIGRCYFWSDSTIVLGWLSMPSNRLKHFVRNRVNEIQDTTHDQTWSYVPSKDNPADLVSRGAQADHLSSSTLWWSGPTFLQHKEIKFFEHPNIHSNFLPEISLRCLNVIFVFLAIKAVHLEVATDLTTEAFIACLNRFVARRGMPQTVYSDNGTNFVGACNQLSSFLKRTSSTLSSEATKWHSSKGELVEGDLVVIKEKNTPPLMWLLGRLERVVPGNDGVARVADIRTKKGVIRRAFNSICCLPISSLLKTNLQRRECVNADQFRWGERGAPRAAQSALHRPATLTHPN
ncbi:hypothetical protein K1T71_015282 [Dendrolimus kikuchii]|nr:hypothetical protein K1T71_015282 [Dendrolimus kikuchii]